MTGKTVFIGLDGATFTILDLLLAQGRMPFLKQLIESGTRAGLRSVVPPITPPAWTSLRTGRSPGRHGVLDFFQVGSPTSPQIQLTTSRDVRCETVSDIANRHRLRTTVLNFPVTFPPPPVDGHVIAGWMPWRQLRLGCHPADLYEQLKALPGFDARKLAMDMEMEAKATEGCSEDELVAWIEFHTQREQSWFEVLRFLMQNEPSDLTAILFDGPDKIQHLCWQYLDPALWPAQPTARAKEIRSRCLDYFGQLDGILAQIAALSGAEATIVIASDHGFGATSEVFYINAWLAQQGYLTWSDKASLNENKPGTLGMNYLSRHMQWLDWEHTTAYASTPTSNGIHIVKADQDGQSGVPPQAYQRFREKLIQDLYSFADPATGEPIVSRIWTREEAFAGPALELAPDLTLALRDGGLVSILPSDAPLKPRPEPAGTHRPMGIFVANGPGVRGGLAARELSILDVAPILLYSLGLAIPKDVEGSVPLEIFEPSFRSMRPIRIAPRSDTERGRSPEPDPEIAYDKESEKLILDRLTALGYLE